MCRLLNRVHLYSALQTPEHASRLHSQPRLFRIVEFLKLVMDRHIHFDYLCKHHRRIEAVAESDLILAQMEYELAFYEVVEAARLENGATELAQFTDGGSLHAFEF